MEASALKKWSLSITWVVVATFLLGMFGMVVEPDIQRWWARMHPSGKLQAFAYAFPVALIKTAILAVPLWWIWRTKKKVDTEHERSAPTPSSTTPKRWHMRGTSFSSISSLCLYMQDGSTGQPLHNN